MVKFYRQGVLFWWTERQASGQKQLMDRGQKQLH